LNKGDLKRISFIEVKSGKIKALTKRERQIKEIISKRKDEWLQINLKEELERARKLI